MPFYIRHSLYYSGENMTFTSIQFILFFPAVTLLYWLIPRRFRKFWLLLCSIFFYGSLSVTYLIILAISIFSTYLSALFLQRQIDREGQAKSRNLATKVSFAAALAINLGMLVYFKYTNFIASTLKAVFPDLIHYNSSEPFNIILPVGISFYIFQVVGYTIDIYRQKRRAETNLLNYALFVAFFPKIMEGPIERSDGFLDQIDSRDCRFDYTRARSGLLLMLWGFFSKMVIADRCAIAVDQVYEDYWSYSGLQILLVTVLYTLQIYTDFMGYSSIAQGGAMVLGYDLTENFHQPYFAVSVKDFWRRWHISLSLWLRDYIYIPLGGSRCSENRKHLNVFLTFLVSGIWHGADFTFIVWGVLHGLLQIFEDLWQPVGDKIIGQFHIDRKSFSHRAFLHIKTFFAVSYAWVFFRAPSLSDALNVIRLTFGWKDSWHTAGNVLTGGLTEIGLSSFQYFMLFAALLILVLHSVLAERYAGGAQLWLNRQNAIARYFIYWVLVVMIVFSTNLSTQEFIYFQF